MLCLNVRCAIRKLAEAENISPRLILEAFADIQNVDPKPRIEVMETTPCMRATDAAKQIVRDFHGQKWLTP